MLLESEIKLIDKSIHAYKNMIEFLKNEMLDLERKKLIKYTDTDECPKCFNIINKQER